MTRFKATSGHRSVYLFKLGHTWRIRIYATVGFRTKLIVDYDFHGCPQPWRWRDLIRRTALG